ncbi:MADS-box transcription factor 18 [Euphorbia peplus]|nr:MADS-box transcription factor 18 [Euphorbia peplus]
MGRGKLKMELLENERARMITFQKRKKGLMKNVEEFSILCKADICLIISGPMFNNRPLDTETWPSDPTEIQRIIERYTSQSDERKKNQDMSHVFESWTKKLSNEIAKLQKPKFLTWDNCLDNLGINELHSISSSLEWKICAATYKILKIKSEVNDNIYLNYMFDNNLGIINSPPYSYQMSMGNPMIPINVNPMISPRLMMLMMGNNENYSQIVGGSSSSNKVNREQVGGSNYDVGNDQMLGNMIGSSVSYCDAITPHQYLSSMVPNVSHQNHPTSPIFELHDHANDVKTTYLKGKF